jgi:hypothetical protein
MLKAISWVITICGLALCAPAYAITVTSYTPRTVTDTAVTQQSDDWTVAFVNAHRAQLLMWEPLEIIVNGTDTSVAVRKYVTPGPVYTKDGWEVRGDAIQVTDTISVGDAVGLWFGDTMWTLPAVIGMDSMSFYVDTLKIGGAR